MNINCFRQNIKYKHQGNFMVALLMNLMRLRGKANYRNLSRYSNYHEKSYSRWFKRDFDFLEFNRLSNI